MVSSTDSDIAIVASTPAAAAGKRRRGRPATSSDDDVVQVLSPPKRSRPAAAAASSSVPTFSPPKKRRAAAANRWAPAPGSSKPSRSRRDDVSSSPPPPPPSRVKAAAGPKKPRAKPKPAAAAVPTDELDEEDAAPVIVEDRKGKGRASEPDATSPLPPAAVPSSAPAPEVDPFDDDDFFVRKPRPVFRARPAPANGKRKKGAPTVASQSSPPASSSTSSSEEEADPETGVMRKKLKKPAKRVVELKGVSSSSSSSSSGSDDDEGKAVASEGPVVSPPTKRKAVALATAPDEPYASMDTLMALVAGPKTSPSKPKAAPAAVVIPSESSSGSDLEPLPGGELDPELAAIVSAARSAAATPAAGSSTAAALGEEISVTVRMIVGPSIERTSENADGLREYESPIQLSIRKREAFEVLAEQVREAKNLPDTIVFTLHGRRIYNSSTPLAIGIFSGAELLGHSQEDWDDIQDTRRRGPAPSTSKPPPELPEIDIDLVPSAPKKQAPVGIRLTLRGTGDRKLQQTSMPTVKISALLDAFAAKHDLTPTQRQSATLEFDGETLDPASTLADIEDFADEDVLDVKLR